MAVDTNAVISALGDAGNAAKVDSTLAGRSPVLSPQALSEIKSFPASDVMDWLGARGGSLGPEATAEGIANLQSQASALGRVLKAADAAVADSAMQQGLGIITNDLRFSRFLNAIGWPVEGY